MKDLQCCFNELQEENQENNSSICGMLQNIDGESNLLNNEAFNIYRINVGKENTIEEKLHYDLQIVKQMVKEETEKVKAKQQL